MIILTEKKKVLKESPVIPLVELPVSDFLVVFSKNRIRFAFKGFDIINVGAVAILSSIGTYIAKKINTMTIEFEGVVDGFVLKLNKITTVAVYDDSIAFNTSDHGFVKFYIKDRSVLRLFTKSEYR